jgi:hypothetical protein
MKCKEVLLQTLRFVALRATLFSTILLAQSILVNGQPLVPKMAARSGSPRTLDRAAAGIPASQLVRNYGKLPLSFEANRGQVNDAVNFLARGQGYTLFLTSGGAVLTVRRALPADQKPDETVKQAGLGRSLRDGLH